MAEWGASWDCMVALRCAPCALITRVVLCASPFPATLVGASGAVCVTVQGFVRAFEAIGHTRLARTHRLWGEPASGPTAFAELVVLLGPADAISGSGHAGTFARD